MPQVEFHTGVAEPLAFACRLLRKAYRQGARVAVTVTPDQWGDFDRLLWTFEERDFVPHVRVSRAAPAVLARTPIWLLDERCPEQGAPTVLVNIGAESSEPWPGLDRIIEVVGDHPDDAVPARGRWRAYESRGYPLVHHKGGAG
ncbi:MAG: DNA polymerase III subunit chi [Rubrivivax sp.]|nr:DNA polymerase III subunit chi [Rubrivivax sp.]